MAVDGDDCYPDLAVGRFPVVEPSEVEAIVDKTIRYDTEGSVGPWRRSLLWITDESESYQQRSDRLAAGLSNEGFGGVKIYPEPEEPSNEAHQATVLDAFDQGQLVVHFYGHGGRFIWRTGPPDLEKNHDLLTLDHLDQLEATPDVPLVMSLTCFSAPFDHPTADSIGEKFLRLPGRGALAVIAASWRNTPLPQFSQAFFDEILAGETVGEAMRRAKHTIPACEFVELYNLLGDPATSLAVPPEAVDLMVAHSDASSLRVKAAVGESARLSDKALVEWLDDGGEIIDSEERAIDSTQFEAELTDPETIARTRAVRVYVWNGQAGVDGRGSLVLGRGRIDGPAARSGSGG